MSLDDAIQDVLPRLREQALSRMRSRVSVRRKVPGGPGGKTGRLPDTYPVVAADIPARIKDRGSIGATAGDVRLELAKGEVHLPWDFTNLQDGDLLEVTAGQWTGAMYRVPEAVRGDDQTARRIPVEETTRPRPEEIP